MGVLRGRSIPSKLFTTSKAEQAFQISKRDRAII